MTLADRFRWLAAAWRALCAIFGAAKAVSASLPPSPSKGDPMSFVSIAQLKSLASILGGGGAQAIAKATSGKPDDLLLAAEEVAALVGVFLPPALAVAEGIDVLRKILPILTALGMKPGDPNTAPSMVKASGPAGTQGVVI